MFCFNDKEGRGPTQIFEPGPPVTLLRYWLYGSETWTMSKEDIKRLEAFEMWIWRRMERTAGWNTGPMNRYLKWWTKKDHLY